MKTLQEVTDYIAANEPQAKNWDEAKFQKWVAWHYSEGFVCVVLDVDQSIAGLAMVRPCMERDAADQMVWDYEGDCLYIAEVVTTKKGALKALGFAVLKRFGMREWVAWQRPPFYILETHKAKALRRNLFRLDYSYGPK